MTTACRSRGADVTHLDAGPAAMAGAPSRRALAVHVSPDQPLALNVREVQSLIAVTRDLGLEGHRSAPDVAAQRIRALCRHLAALRSTISTRGRDPSDRQLQRDTHRLLQQPHPDTPPRDQAAHLLELAEAAGRFLAINQRRAPTPPHISER